MNPSRSVGPAIIAGNFKDLWIYVTAPTIGAVSGGLLYRFLRLRQPAPLITPINVVSS